MPGGVLAKHCRVLTKLSLVLDKHYRVLEKHSLVLEKHYRVLEKHSRVLTKHSRVLEKHSDQSPACAKLPITAGSIFQMSRAYSRIVRSDENFPILAMFRSDLRRQTPRSR